ncbi:hypothetical protein RJ639_022539 [Escallonia herrerae]|uniref:Uncharacterized protein n=1 Tax=Escallonia herrerae TaxID=1293975 RepID=A0AA88V245_9ASTE|nr:hypothetical protein RJ639_022539 [Escallonia herrerae]
MFHPARERFKQADFEPVRLRLFACRASDGRLNNMPNADEVARLIPSSDPSNPRDIIVDDRTVGLKRIIALYPSFMAMQYPVLFPYDKCPTPADVDRIISAEIPNEKEDPAGYNAVKQFMMHRPCGDSRPHNLCMRDGECSKNYPKSFNSETYVDENGFPVYKRHDDGREIIGKDNIPLDKRNMRLQKKTPQNYGGMSVEEFGQWIIDLGDGKLTTYSLENEFDPAWIKVPT